MHLALESGPDGGLGIESPSRGPTERPGLIGSPGSEVRLADAGTAGTQPAVPGSPGGRLWQGQLALPGEAPEWAPWGWSSLSGRREVGCRPGEGRSLRG